MQWTMYTLVAYWTKMATTFKNLLIIFDNKLTYKYSYKNVKIVLWEKISLCVSKPKIMDSVFKRRPLC